MNNFYRAVRLALKYRWTLVGSLVCAVMVGVLWGANIATVKPFVEVAFQGQSLQQWVDGEIKHSQSELAVWSAKVSRLQGELARFPNSVAIQGELGLAQARLKAEREALSRARGLRPYIYNYLPSAAFPTLLIIAAVLLVGTLFKGLFLIGNNILVNRLSQLASFDLRKLMYRQTLKLDMASFGSDGSAELMSRFTYDMENVHRGLNSLFGKAVREPLKMVACLVGAAMICWRLLALSLVLAPIAAWLVRKLAKVLKRANRRAMQEMSQMYSLLEETFLGIKVVKAFTMERYERRQFHECSKNYYIKSMRIARYESLTRPITELMGVVTILVAILAGAYLVLNGETHLLGIRMSDRPLSLSSLLLFYGLLSGVSDPARKLSEVFSRLQRAAAACDRVYSLVDRRPQVDDTRTADGPETIVLPPSHRVLEFQNVSFRYTPETPVLQEINLRVTFGETIAIVGPNGCGKSTLVSLLPRFFDPTEGRVTIDGHDLRHVRLRSLRSQIGLVTQETLLFDDTIANNIRYGCQGATQEEVVAAAQQAHAHRFILDRLSDGYETIVGPQGNQLSGGQRQRIALARAILRNPPILLLDEATSQIDLESEQVIHKVLEQFTRGRTTFIITHRMSTLTLADRIVVMNAGKILDAGTHDELLQRCPLYSRLHDLQFRETA